MDAVTNFSDALAFSPFFFHSGLFTFKVVHDFSRALHPNPFNFIASPDPVSHVFNRAWRYGPRCLTERAFRSSLPVEVDL